MAGPEQVGFDYALRIEAPAGRILAAFFDSRALGEWWDVANAVATPRPLGVYALEWKTSSTVDDLLGRFGGVLHGSVIDFRPRRGFLVADCYWLPPDGDPIGPMALDVSCTAAPGPRSADDLPLATLVRVVQRGLDDDSPRWRRYYELLNSGWPPALERMKAYLEKGRGVWDLRGYD